MTRWLSSMRWFTRAGALLALGGVVAEFGFGLAAGTLSALHALEAAVVASFVFSALAHLATSRQRLRLMRENWLDVLLVVAIAASFGGVVAGDPGDTLRHLSFAGVQGLIVARMLLSLARAQEHFAGPRVRPALLLFMSFLALVLVGAAALLMPLCRAESAAPFSVLDAVFTATSAVCVTGLSVRDVGTELSLRGQFVLLVLIQIGGLGLVTIGTAITVIERSRPKLRLVAMAGDLLGLQSLARLRRFLAYTVLITLTVELTGAAILASALPRDTLSLADRAWWGLFHSVSAFCNAGFGLSSQSLVPWADQPTIPLAIAALIVVGGLGFPVLIDLLRFQLTTLRWIRLARTRIRALPRARWLSRKWGFVPWLRSPSSALQLPRPTRLELNTKLVLVMNALLVAGGALLFFLAESGGVLAQGSLGQAVTNSLFQSITARTAGFNTVDLGLLALPTLLLIMALMAVGASSVSTGGGVKTGTVAIVLLTIRAMVRDREQVEAFGRTIPVRLVHTSIAVAALYGAAVATVTTLLAATQRDIAFVDLLFESISALSTVGLTHGVTLQLDGTGRVVIAGAMLLGRVGPLAIVWTFLARRERLRYRYPEEEVVIS